MSSPESQKRELLSWVGFAGFFTFAYLHLWLRLDLRQFYDVHKAFPAFSLTPAFFREHLTYPGGLVEYVGAYLSQYYSHPWAGALIVTLLCALLTLGTREFLRAMSGGTVRLAPYLPAVLMLVTIGRCGHYVAMMVGLIVVLASACLYASLRVQRPATRFLLMIVLGAPLYYVVGGTFLLYPMLCGLLEIYVRRQRLLGLLCFLVAELIPHGAAAFVFGLERGDAYWRTLPLHRDADGTAAVFALSVFFSVPLAALLTGVWASRGGGRERDAARARPVGNHLAPAVQSVAAAAAVAVVVLLSVDTTTQGWRRLYCHAVHERWEQVLQEAERLPDDGYTYPVLHNVNAALYHTGRLPFDMFAYPQDVDTLMVGMEPRNDATQFMLSNVHLELAEVASQLGLVNEAEHWSHEFLVQNGARPRVLESLARQALARGETEAARMFLRVLRTNPLERRHAEEMLTRLDTDPLLSENEELQRLRSVAAPREAGQMWVSLEERLTALLKHNPHNRMAFEYLMAYYLLGRRLDMLVANLPRLDDFDYTGIPRLYEEAVVVYRREIGKPVDLGGREVSPDTLRRFEEFQQFWSRLDGMADPRAGIQTLRASYGDSYFFYHYFVKPGAGT